MFNQGTKHSTSLNNVDGPCGLPIIARYDKTGTVVAFLH